MINYFCCALKTFEGAKFLYYLTFLCNQIKGNAGFFFFNNVWYFSKALLYAYICYLPAQVTRIWGRGKQRVRFAAEFHAIIFVSYCLNSPWQKYQPCAISADLGDF